MIAKTSEQLLEQLKSEIKQESESNFNWELTEILVNLVAMNWKDNPHTLLWLKDCPLQDENNDVRRAAVSAIVQYSPIQK
ncbi:MAG: hypothetical protein ACK5CA_11280 [Cyanobacteriota bacterium]